MSLASAANRVWDPDDPFLFDLVKLSGRDLNDAIRNAPTADLEAAFPSTRPTETPPSAA